MSLECLILPENLLMVRHGESYWNAAQNSGEFQDGDLDKQDHEFGLTDMGIKQAGVSLSWTLQNLGITWDRVLSSELPRAYDTARLALPGILAEIEIDPGLNERDWGIETRRSIIRHVRAREEGSMEWLDAMRRNFLDNPPVDGPTLREFRETQIAPAIGKILRTERCEKNVAIFSHGETTTAMLWELLGLGDEIVLKMKNLPNVNGVLLSTLEPETRENTGRISYARRIDPLSYGSTISDWQELIRPEDILAVVGSRDS